MSRHALEARGTAPSLSAGFGEADPDFNKKRIDL
jgi:hypothetical protein